MAIDSLAVVSVPVSDQDRAKAFYVDQLGFSVRTDMPGPDGSRWLEVVPGAGQTRLTLVTHFPTMPAGSLRGMVLDTDDCQATVDALKGRGVRFTQDVTDDFWGTWASFDDPDGNGWVVAKAKL